MRRENKLGFKELLRYGPRREKGEQIRVSCILEIRTEEGGGRTDSFVEILTEEGGGRTNYG